MYKFILSLFYGCLMSFGLHAQSNDIKQLLDDIEQNNKQLKAFQSLIESQQLDYKTTNNLPDPEASGYYLPFGTHTAGNYTEFQLSQSFEFPTVYGARKKLIYKQEKQLQLKYEKLQQEVLLSAKNYCLELILLNKIKSVEEQRMVQAKKVFDHAQVLYEKEQVGILELNKAKIAWLQNQFALEQIENDENNTMIALTHLNGGESISFDQALYPDLWKISAFDSMWQEKISTDPFLTILIENEILSSQFIKLQKNKGLPNLTAGYNYQGIREQNYSGIYGGISIPIWNNRFKVKTANAQLQYQQLRTEAITADLLSDFRGKYNKYQLLLRKFREYQNTLEALNSDSLLFQAYELGEISYMEYYIELQFYRQAFDKMLQVEFDLNKLKAELLKHNL